MKEFIEKQTDMVEEKIKVTSLEIIVTGTKDKPYFELKYKEVGKEDYTIGYSSYDLNNVFDWKEECFEIVNELAEEHNGGWIPCSERLPEIEDYVLCWYEYYRFGSYNRMYQTYGLGYYIKQYDMWGGEVNQGQKCRVIAWQPLPAPYDPKGE